MKKRNSDFKGTPVILPDPLSSELMVIFPPLQVAID
jgi:hypothetical protein